MGCLRGGTPYTSLRLIWPQSAETGLLTRDSKGKGRDVDREQIAREVLDAVGGKDNVIANDICMTRLRILTQDPELVDTEKLSAARGVLGFVRRGTNAIEVVFGPGKVEAVHEAIVRLTEMEGNEEAFSGVEKKSDSASMRVHISQNPLYDAARAQSDLEARSERADAVDDLVSLLDTMDPAEGDLPGLPEEDEPCQGALGRVLVINGPNINLLGIREPEIYGADTYRALLRLCHDAAREAGFSECTCFQSNHEGDLIDAIQDAYGSYDGIIINPGAYTHTSVALLDAARSVGLPMVEVHISRVEDREDFRQVSYIRAACFETITGMGIEGYRKAMRDLASHLGM